jgi:hypothetical protein
MVLVYTDSHNTMVTVLTLLYSPSTNLQTSVSKKAEGLVEGDKASLCTACFNTFATSLGHCKPQELLFRHFDGNGLV